MDCEQNYDVGQFWDSCVDNDTTHGIPSRDCSDQGDSQDGIGEAHQTDILQRSGPSTSNTTNRPSVSGLGTLPIAYNFQDCQMSTSPIV